MKDIEELALQTFSENLLYFQTAHPELFLKIEALNNAINNTNHKEIYALEFEDTYFDVVEISTKKQLYNTNSNNHADIVAKSVDFIKYGNLYETFNDVRISDEYKEELEAMEVTQNSYSGAASLINYSNKYADKETTTMKKIYKFIFCGVGLGLHIKKVHEKIKANVYFVIEDDLELFRLSLFCTNYSSIAKDGAVFVFSIFEDDDNFKSYTKVFLETQFMYNHYLKYFHLLSHSQSKLKKIQNVIVSQTYLTFNYSALTVGLLRPLEHLERGYKIVNIGDKFSGTVFMEKPVLILGAGPSFENNIQWVQKNAHKFIIVAVTALLSKLEEMNIKPDIITHIHGFKDALVHVQRVKDMTFFDTTIALFSTFSEAEFLTYFKKKNIYLFEGSSRYKEWDIGLTSSNVGSVTYALMMMLKTKNLYLLGLDFAMDQETGDTHSSGHNFSRKVVLAEDEELGGELILNESVIKVRGNFKEKVFTTLLMDSWKDQCNSLTYTYKTVQNYVFNLSDGAYIEDAQALDCNDASIQKYEEIQKDVLYNRLDTIFNKNSENFLNQEELKNLELRVEYCDKILTILETHMKIKHGNINQYHYNILGVFYEILTDERKVDSSDIDYLITLYLQFVSGYIFDIINTAEIEDEEILIDFLDKKVVSQIIKIVSFFKESIQKSLNLQKEEV